MSGCCSPLFALLCVLVTLSAVSGFGVSLPSALRARSSSLYMGTTLVFGGTGKTGAECVYQSLEAGENVVVLARDPAKMIYPEGSGGIANAGKQIMNDGLKVIQGTVTDAGDVQKCFDAATDDITGVVVALGGKTKDVGKTMLTGKYAHMNSLSLCFSSNKTMLTSPHISSFSLYRRHS